VVCGFRAAGEGEVALRFKPRRGEGEREAPRIEPGEVLPPMLGSDRVSCTEEWK
jgi:hypothetical protein